MRRVTAGSTIAAALLALVLLATRANAVVAAGTWGQTSGYEAVSLNLVGRTALGIPPYGDLEQDATPALFNGLFYLTYGAAARAAGVATGPVVPLRFFSLILVLTATMLFGAGISGSFRRQGLGRWSGALGGAVAVAVLLGPFVGWWALTVRPDPAVLALETCALLAIRRAAPDEDRLWFVVAAACAILAWCFKQNAVTVGGVLFLSAVIERRWLRAAGVALAWAAAAVGIRLWAGPHYLFHTISMAASAEYALSYAVLHFGLAVRLAGPLLLLAVIVAPQAIADKGERRLAVIFLLALVIGSAQLFRVGTDRNYLFLAWTSGTLVVVDHVRRILLSRWRWLLPAVALHACAITAVYLVAADRIGRVRVVTADERAAAVARGRVIRAAAGPRFVQDNVEALPWHSGQTVIETIDDSIYWEALRRGLIHESVFDRIARRHYASGFVLTPNMRQAFDAAGYEHVIVPELGEMSYYRLTPEAR